MSMITTDTLLKPPEGHSSLFFTSRGTDSESSEPQGLPVEAFLSIMDHLSERDLVRASHVCWNWRKEIIGCSRLWQKLEDVKVGNMSSLDRVRAFVSRSKGQLRTLTFDFEPEGDLELSMLPIVPLLRQMFHEISRLDGARSLTKLELDLRPYRHEDDLDPAFKLIALTCQFAEFSAVNLKEFKLITCLPRFPSGAPFWFSITSLKKIVITCQNIDDGRELPDFFSTVNAVSATQLSTSRLEKILFVDTSLTDVTYPTFTHLTTLRLYEMTVLNLYGLLSKCASTLQTLELRQVTSDSPSKYLPNSAPNVANNNNKDLPPVLSLPQLKKIQTCGNATPLLWVAPADGKTSFMTETPSLERVDFGHRHYFEILDDYDDDDGDEIPGCQDLDSTLLSNLFRRSPQLSAVNFKRTNVSPQMLIASLPDASSYLAHLSIGGTSACQDSLVDRLASLVPQLKELDVFDDNWVGEAERTVTVQALARFTKAMLEVSPLRRSGGGDEWSLEITADGYFRHTTTSADDIRMSLKNLLVSLSASQLSHLGSQLVFNAPPVPKSLASSPITFNSIKAELEELVTPAPDPPCKNGAPFPAKPGEPGYVKLEPKSPESLKKQKKGGGGGTKQKQTKKKKMVSKIPAPQDVVDQAEKLLQDWVTKREQDAAMRWFEEQEEAGKRVEIQWGDEMIDHGEMWKDESSDDEDSDADGTTPDHHDDSDSDQEGRSGGEHD